MKKVEIFQISPEQEKSMGFDEIHFSWEIPDNELHSHT